MSEKGWKMGPIETKESTFIMWRVYGDICFSNMFSYGKTWGGDFVFLFIFIYFIVGGSWTSYTWGNCSVECVGGRVY
jgi:hypothetical protein